MDSDLETLVRLLVEGDVKACVAEVRKPQAVECDRQRRVVDALQIAMQRMEAKCTPQQFNLLEIMLTGRAVMAGAREGFPEGTPAQSLGTVVIGTPQGDVHDIGKNVTKMVLIAKGYRVVDCGKDCPVETMVDAAAREGAFAVLVSGLITAVIPHVRRLRDLIQARGLQGVKVLAGGAALKQSSPEALDVDMVAQDAFDAARLLDALCAGRT